MTLRKTRRFSFFFKLKDKKNARLRLSLSAHYSWNYSGSEWSRLTKEFLSISEVVRTIRRSLSFSAQSRFKAKLFLNTIPLCVVSSSFPFLSRNLSLCIYLYIPVLTVTKSGIPPGVPVQSIPRIHFVGPPGRY